MSNRLQVVEETATILRHFGFEFDQRGLILVKGKGKLMTFYLTGRQPAKAAPAATVSMGQQAAAGAVHSAQSAGVDLDGGASQMCPESAIQPNQAPQRNSLHSIRSQDSLGPCLTSEADNKRMFITPSRRDYDTDADIHLV